MTHLHLLAGLDVQLQQLVDGLLEVQGALDGQIDCPPQGDKVGLGGVNNLLFLVVVLLVLVII